MITIEYEGRLGNQLFQYITTRIVAEKNGYDFCCYGHNFIGNRIFENFNSGDCHLTKYHNNIYNDREGTLPYNDDILSIPDNTKLVGYFAYAPELFLDFDHNKVKEWLKIKNNINIYEIDYNNTCVIHLRGTDYLEIDDYILPRKYYDDSIKYMKDIGINDFVVITDDLNYSKEFFPEYKSLSSSIECDFKSLYNAKYSIISNSTFAWWSRWLSNGITIAPKRWVGYNTPEKGWIGPSCKTEKFIYIDK